MYSNSFMKMELWIKQKIYILYCKKDLYGMIYFYY